MWPSVTASTPSASLGAPATRGQRPGSETRGGRLAGSGSVAALAKFFEATNAPQTVVKQRHPSTVPSQRGLGQSSAANQQASHDPDAEPEPGSTGSLKQRQQKRQRLASEADSEKGQQLWTAGLAPSREASSDAEAAREARLEKIRARFGTKPFLAARQLEPEELRCQLDATKADLDEDDYIMYRWEGLPILLSQTSNAHCLNWVLSGQSGSVSIASSLTHIFVLGAGHTIFLDEADAVHAVRDELGVFIRLGSTGQASSMSLKVPDEALAAKIVAILNARAATRATLRKRAEAGGHEEQEVSAGMPASKQ